MVAARCTDLDGPLCVDRRRGRAEGGMKTIWKASTRDELRARLGRLTPGSMPRWGRMTAPQMVAHLADSARMALGDLPVAPKRVPLRYPPLKQLCIYCLPIPKGVPTAPELIHRSPGDWEHEVN